MLSPFLEKHGSQYERQTFSGLALTALIHPLVPSAGDLCLEDGWPVLQHLCFCLLIKGGPRRALELLRDMPDKASAGSFLKSRWKTKRTSGQASLGAGNPCGGHSLQVHPDLRAPELSQESIETLSLNSRTAGHDKW